MLWSDSMLESPKSLFRLRKTNYAVHAVFGTQLRRRNPLKKQLQEHSIAKQRSRSDLQPAILRTFARL